MNSVEKTASSEEEAVEAALAELGVGPEEVEVELVDRARGFLGIFGKEAVTVKVTVREQGESAPEEGSAPAQEAEAAEELEEPAEPPTGPLSELAQEAEATLTKILALMAVDASAEVRSVDEEEIHIDLSGPDVALLIGRHGDTLDALQLLTALASARRCEHRGRIILDAESYRERRQQMLENMAHSHAERAKRSQQEVVLPDLKPYERRIIHMALVDDPEVTTYSEGEGQGRRLIISPAD